MSKTYLIAGILFVVIVGGAWGIRLMSTKTQPAPSEQSAGMPVPETKDVTEKVVETMKPKQYTSPPPMTIDPKKFYTATIVTDKGTMTVKLFASETPVTVNNFIFLAREGFYASTIFHRIIKGFMIQGGDPLGTGMGGPGYTFVDEKVTRDYTRGTIAMANSGPNTNGSQFFIMHADYPLPKNYVIFGAIDPSDTASLQTLDAIATAPTTDNGMGETSKPVTPTVLQSISVEEK
jgi:cyclophilin family peptidyl-prolyl cis-trans isomerase